MQADLQIDADRCVDLQMNAGRPEDWLDAGIATVSCIYLQIDVDTDRSEDRYRYIYS